MVQRLKYVVMAVVFLCSGLSAQDYCPKQCACSNFTMECYQSMPDFIPVFVTKVIVYEIYLHDKLVFNDSGWANVTYLAINPGSSVSHSPQDSYLYIGPKTFIGLESLEYLQLACECLYGVLENAFYGLSKLTVLDLSHNINIPISMIVQGLKGKDILPNLSELYLSSSSVSTSDIFLLGEEFTDAIKRKPLKILDISNTETAWFSNNKDLPYAFPHLEIFNLSGSGNAVSSVSKVFSHRNQLVTSFKQLKVIDISYPSDSSKLSLLSASDFTNLTVLNNLNSSKLTVLGHLNSSNQVFLGQSDVTNFTTLSQLTSINLTALDFKTTNLTFLVPVGNVNLTDVTVSVMAPIFPDEMSILIPDQLMEIYAKKFMTHHFNNMINGSYTSSGICIHVNSDTKQPVCLTGRFNSLKKLVLSENLLTYINPDLAQAGKALQHIDLSKNILGKSVAQENYLKSVLEHLNYLEEFLLSENQISTLPEDSFESSKLLKYLDLSRNKIETISFKTQYFLSLQKLDLSYNRIIFLDSSNFRRLTSLLDNSNRSTNNNMTHLSLDGNPFKCSCESTPFLKWLAALNETHKCVFNSEIFSIDEYSIKRVEYTCKENTVIIIYAILGVSELIAVIVFTYYLIHEIKRTQKCKKVNKGISVFAKTGNDNISPVFLSFSGEDEDLVMNYVYPHLNEGLKKILGTESRCVSTGEMDFHPGFSLANEIIRCIDASAVVVLALTNTFCKKNWCKNEALVAYSDNKPTVIILLEKVDVNIMPKHIYKHYQQYTRAHLVLEGGQRIMKPDWNELCASIVRLMGENLEKVHIRTEV